MGKALNHIPIYVYTDAGDNPCCALNFETGDVCMFYRTRHFGQVEFCEITSEKLERRGTDGLGTLIPVKKCLVWNSD